MFWTLQFSYIKPVGVTWPGLKRMFFIFTDTLNDHSKNVNCVQIYSFCIKSATFFGLKMTAPPRRKYGTFCQVLSCSHGSTVHKDRQIGMWCCLPALKYFYRHLQIFLQSKKCGCCNFAFLFWFFVRHLQIFLAKCDYCNSTFFLLLSFL